MMLIHPPSAPTPILGTRAKHALEKLKESFGPSKAFIAKSVPDGWELVTGLGLPQDTVLGDSELAVGALEFAAAEKQFKIFADTAGPAQENFLAFLSGAPLDVVMVGHIQTVDQEFLVYLSRSFTDGLYNETDLENFEQVVRAELISDS